LILIGGRVLNFKARAVQDRWSDFGVYFPDGHLIASADGDSTEKVFLFGDRSNAMNLGWC
jgi:hypothetical protein